MAYRDTETHLKTCRYTHNLQGRYCHFPCHEYFQLHPGREFVSRPPPVKLYVHLLCVPLSLAHTHKHTHTNTHTHTNIDFQFYLLIFELPVKYWYSPGLRQSLFVMFVTALELQILLFSVVKESLDDEGLDFVLEAVFDLDSGGVRSVTPVKLLCPQSFWCAQCENGIFVFDGARSIAAFGGNNFKSVFIRGRGRLPEAVTCISYMYI